MDIGCSISIMRRGVLVAIAIGVLAACGRSEQAAATQDGEPVQAGESVPAETAVSPAAAPGPAPEPAKPVGFDLASVPVSDRALGAFPFIALPEGYEAIDEQTLNIARVPFWTGDRLENVEGKVYMATIQEQQGWTYSHLELERNIQHVVEQAGGMLVTDSNIAPDVLESVSRDVRVSLVGGWGDVYNYPVRTYVIRNTDKTVWLHLCADSAGAGLIIVEAKAFEATASLLPADALKREIDAHGKVAMQIHFAVDKADIMPDSMPQIEQVTSLLNNDPVLKLSINGHTDNTGDAAHNQVLSEARAKSVVAALIARGIDESRLQAKGQGQSEPVADNATEAGRAKNRRVELVRI